MRAWRSLSLPLDVVTTLSSGQRVGQRGGLGHRAACPVVKPQWWYKTILEASLVTEDAKTISASVSKVASCDDHIITSLQAYLILWRSRVFPPALHAFRASTLHGFYPAFRSRDAIIPHLILIIDLDPDSDPWSWFLSSIPWSGRNDSNLLQLHTNSKHVSSFHLSV